MENSPFCTSNLRSHNQGHVNYKLSNISKDKIKAWVYYISVPGKKESVIFYKKFIRSPYLRQSKFNLVFDLTKNLLKQDKSMVLPIPTGFDAVIYKGSLICTNCKTLISHFGLKDIVLEYTKDETDEVLKLSFIQINEIDKKKLTSFSYAKKLSDKATINASLALGEVGLLAKAKAAAGYFDRILTSKKDKFEITTLEQAGLFLELLNDQHGTTTVLGKHKLIEKANNI